MICTDGGSWPRQKPRPVFEIRSRQTARQSIGFGGVGFTNACGHLALPYRSNRSDGINGLAAKPSNLGAQPDGR